MIIYEEGIWAPYMKCSWDSFLFEGFKFNYN